jgi:hypothetical protein
MTPLGRSSLSSSSTQPKKLRSTFNTIQAVCNVTESDAFRPRDTSLFLQRLKEFSTAFDSLGRSGFVLEPPGDHPRTHHIVRQNAAHDATFGTEKNRMRNAFLKADLEATKEVVQRLCKPTQSLLLQILKDWHGVSIPGEEDRSDLQISNDRYHYVINAFGLPDHSVSPGPGRSDFVLAIDNVHDFANDTQPIDTPDEPAEVDASSMSRTNLICDLSSRTKRYMSECAFVMLAIYMFDALTDRRDPLMYADMVAVMLVWLGASSFGYTTPTSSHARALDSYESRFEFLAAQVPRLSYYFGLVFRAFVSLIGLRLFMDWFMHDSYEAMGEAFFESVTSDFILSPASMLWRNAVVTERASVNLNAPEYDEEIWTRTISFVPETSGSDFGSLRSSPVTAHTDLGGLEADLGAAPPPTTPSFEYRVNGAAVLSRVFITSVATMASGLIGYDFGLRVKFRVLMDSMFLPRHENASRFVENVIVVASSPEAQQYAVDIVREPRTEDDAYVSFSQAVKTAWNPSNGVDISAFITDEHKNAAEARADRLLSWFIPGKRTMWFDASIAEDWKYLSSQYASEPALVEINARCLAAWDLLHKDFIALLCVLHPDSYSPMPVDRIVARAERIKQEMTDEQRKRIAVLAPLVHTTDFVWAVVKDGSGAIVPPFSYPAICSKLRTHRVNGPFMPYRQSEGGRFDSRGYYLRAHAWAVQILVFVVAFPGLQMAPDEVLTASGNILHFWRHAEPNDGFVRCPDTTPNAVTLQVSSASVQSARARAMRSWSRGGYSGLKHSSAAIGAKVTRSRTFAYNTSVSRKE